MVHTDDDDGNLPDLSNRELLRFLMQEMANMYRELREDIQKVDTKVDGVSKDVKKLQSDVHTLRIEVHHNQSTFIANHNMLEKRVEKLELAA